MEKQIEEKCPCQTDTQSCCACVSMKCHECFKPKQSKFIKGRFCSNCGRPLKAEVKRNYRKASDVAREISQDILEPVWKTFSTTVDGETKLLVALILEFINAELKKKYTEEK